MAVDGFFDNAPVERLVKDGFVERLAKERGK
jgi:hypothetical protein